MSRAHRHPARRHALPMISAGRPLNFGPLQIAYYDAIRHFDARFRRRMRAARLDDKRRATTAACRFRFIAHARRARRADGGRARERFQRMALIHLPIRRSTPCAYRFYRHYFRADGIG